MEQEIEAWLAIHYVELAGALLGFLYIYFSIRQNILTWPVGLISSALYIYVFFTSKFYADMLLQVYYVVVSVYGWYYWLHGNSKEKANLKVQKTPFKLIVPLVAASGVFWGILYFALKNYTDSPVPVCDSLTTALSIVATWMLARKYIEQWWMWVFIDGFSAVLYGYKSLWPTTILFLVYAVLAVLGYYRWRKELSPDE